MSDQDTLTLHIRLRRAWQQGYVEGSSGMDTASPPYPVTASNEAVIREWRAGHRTGLLAYRQAERRKQEEERLGGLS